MILELIDKAVGLFAPKEYIPCQLLEQASMRPADHSVHGTDVSFFHARMGNSENTREITVGIATNHLPPDFGSASLPCRVEFRALHDVGPYSCGYGPRFKDKFK